MSVSGPIISCTCTSATYFQVQVILCFIMANAMNPDQSVTTGAGAVRGQSDLGPYCL